MKGGDVVETSGDVFDARSSQGDSLKKNRIDVLMKLRMGIMKKQEQCLVPLDDNLSFKQEVQEIIKGLENLHQEQLLLTIDGGESKEVKILKHAIETFELISILFPGDMNRQALNEWFKKKFFKRVKETLEMLDRTENLNLHCFHISTLLSSYYLTEAAELAKDNNEFDLAQVIEHFKDNPKSRPLKNINICVQDDSKWVLEKIYGLLSGDPLWFFKNMRLDCQHAFAILMWFSFSSEQPLKEVFDAFNTVLNFNKTNLHPLPADQDYKIIYDDQLALIYLYSTIESNSTIPENEICSVFYSSGYAENMTDLYFGWVLCDLLRKHKKITLSHESQHVKSLYESTADLCLSNALPHWAAFIMKSISVPGDIGFAGHILENSRDHWVKNAEYIKILVDDLKFSKKYIASLKVSYWEEKGRYEEVFKSCLESEQYEKAHEALVLQIAPFMIRDQRTYKSVFAGYLRECQKHKEQISKWKIGGAILSGETNFESKEVASFWRARAKSREHKTCIGGLFLVTKIKNEEESDIDDY